MKKLCSDPATSVPASELETIAKALFDNTGWSPRGVVANPERLAARKERAEKDFFAVRRNLIITSTEDAVRYSGTHDRETFSLSKPEVLDQEINPNSVWMTDVQIELVSPDVRTGPEQTWWLAPRLNSGGLLHHLFGGGARVNRHGSFSVRVENNIGRYSRHAKPEIKINLPPLGGVVPLLIAYPQYRPIYTIDARYEERHTPSQMERAISSDKGDYLRGLIRVFGDFWIAKEFCERRLWRHMFTRLANYDARNDAESQRDIANLLRKRIPAHDPPEYLASRVLSLMRGQAKRGLALPYSEFKKELDELAKTPPPAQLQYQQGGMLVHHHGIQHLTEEELRGGLDKLVDLGVLRVGVYVRCGYCGIRPWYFIDDLKQQVRCPGCGHTQSVGAEQEWCYALNSLAEMGVIQGQLRVVQALGALASNSLQSFFYSPSVDLFKHGCKDHWHELDIASVAEGDLVIGEVKGGERGVTRNDFDELAEIAESLRPQRAIMFLPLESVTQDVMSWLGDTAKRLAVNSIKAQVYALPSF